MSDEFQERSILAEERKAAALESIALQLPSLIVAIEKSRSGGSWSGKKGNDHGIFAIPPDPATIPVNDTYQIPVIWYNWQSQAERLCFFSPFDQHGQILPTDKVGVSAGTCKKGSKTFERLFAGWKINTDGKAHAFPLRILIMKVGEGKEDKKRFVFVDGISDPGVTDPAQLTYSQPVKTGEKNDASDGNNSAQ